jgi:hypothetical protein
MPMAASGADDATLFSLRLGESVVCSSRDNVATRAHLSAPGLDRVCARVRKTTMADNVEATVTAAPRTRQLLVRKDSGQAHRFGVDSFAEFQPPEAVAEGESQRHGASRARMTQLSHHHGSHFALRRKAKSHAGSPNSRARSQEEMRALL